MANIVQGVKDVDSINGTNLGFFVGRESKLSTITAVDGVFYLTSDTHRLFIGDKDGNLSPVNQGVISIDDLSDLPTSGEPGQFYYVKSPSNILCVRSGNQWVQINTNTYLNEISHKVESVTNGAQVSTGGELSNGNPVTSGSFNIIGDGTEVKVTKTDATTVKVSGAAYTLDNSVAETEASVTLKRDGSAVSKTFAMTPGSNITFEKDSNGKLVINATDQASGAKIKSFVASNNKADTTPTTGFHFVITDGSNQQYKTDIDPIIEYGGDSKTSINFVDGKATLDVYTKSEIDNTVLKNFQKTVNAMTYKGIVNADVAGETLPTSQVQIGDVWMMTTTKPEGAVFPGSEDSTKYQSGTLAIAQGTEGSDGYIEAGKLNWVIVQNFNTDTQYTWAASNSTNSGALTVTKDQDNSEVGKIEVKTSGSTPITVTGTASGTTQTIQIEHKEQTVSTSTDTGWEGDGTAAEDLFIGNVIAKIETNGTGHITSVKTKQISIKSPILSSSSATTAAADKTYATRTHEIKLKNSKGADISVVTAETKIKSQNLEITKDDTDSAIKINMVWGTF